MLFTDFKSKPRVLVSAIMLSTLTGCLSKTEFLTRDIGTMVASCNNDAIEFIVSVNNDDDKNKTAKPKDKKLKKLGREEDNLRIFEFKEVVGAAQVKIDAPEDAATEKSVEGSRVRSWAEPTTAGDYRTSNRFAFGGRHDLPVKLYMDGKSKSGGRKDTVIKYRYYERGAEDDDIFCSAEFQGTVLDVEASLGVDSSSGQFKRVRKMLSGGAGSAEAKLKPAVPVTVGWNDENGGVFANSDKLTTVYTAPLSLTRPLDSQQVRVRLELGGQVIEAHRPVNITAPARVKVTKDGSFRNVSSALLSANDTKFTLFKGRQITYEIQDQFDKKIKESAYGGRIPQIRENIGNSMTSTIPNVRRWIANDLSWTENWKDKSAGEFTDGLNAFGIGKDKIRVRARNAQGQLLQTFEFHDNLRTENAGTPTGEMMRSDHHIWQVSVNGDNITNVTDNSFVVQTVHMQGNPIVGGGLGVKIKLSSTYSLGSPPN